MLKNKWIRTSFALLLVGCAGTMRSCQSCEAENFGANWIVVQYKTDGNPINCWRLNAVSVVNEEHSDGIHWLESSGHLVHISGWYNRVQVKGQDWSGAADSIGINLDACHDGKYIAPSEK